MPEIVLDHVTLRVVDLEGHRQFFKDVFGLVEKARPKIIERIPGKWLYHGETPLIHLIKSYGNPVDMTTNAIDHVGFLLPNYTEFKQKLTRLNISYSFMDIKELCERRLFFRTPEGVILEAVFKG